MVDRIQNPTLADLDKYIASNTPLVMTGLSAEWKANQWDIPYLSTKIGHANVQAVVSHVEQVYWDPSQGLPQQPMTFDMFAEKLRAERQGGKRVYLQDDINSFPILREDYDLPQLMARMPLKRTKVWVSGTGMVTPLHYDAVETFHWVVRGKKRFTCFAPGVVKYYPNSWLTTAPFISKVDAYAPDYRQFPRFKEAVPIDFELQAGEILYLPAFFWHQVASLGELNISVNFVWFASAGKNLRFLPQFARCLRHLAVQLRKVRAKAAKAALESARDQVGQPTGASPP